MSLLVIAALAVDVPAVLKDSGRVCRGVNNILDNLQISPILLANITFDEGLQECAPEIGDW